MQQMGHASGREEELMIGRVGGCFERLCGCCMCGLKPGRS